VFVREHYSIKSQIKRYRDVSCVNGKLNCVVVVRIFHCDAALGHLGANNVAMIAAESNYRRAATDRNSGARGCVRAGSNVHEGSSSTIDIDEAGSRATEDFAPTCSNNHGAIVAVSEVEKYVL
jgi:hypothetical protein